MTTLYEKAEVRHADQLKETGARGPWPAIRDRLWDGKKGYGEYNDHVIKAQVLSMALKTGVQDSVEVDPISNEVKTELENFHGFIWWLLEEGWREGVPKKSPEAIQEAEKRNEKARSEKRRGPPVALGLRGVLAVLQAHIPLPRKGDIQYSQSLLDDLVDVLGRQSVGVDSPLRGLVRDWGVRRFITTNYDREIEKSLEAQGFASRSEDTVQANQIHSTTFSREATGDSLRFAFEGTRRHAEILHLHGDVQDASSLIVTEEQYQRLYLDDHPTRDLVTNAALGLFAANPMFFVGSDAGEDDVMRPMRQFMSGDGHRRDRMAVALFPALRDKHHRAQRATSLLLRYGVLAIYYGWENDPDAASGAGNRDEATKPWLERISKLNKDLHDIPDSGKDAATSRKAWSEALDDVAKLSAPVLMEGVLVAEGSPLDLSPAVKWIADYAGDQVLRASGNDLKGREATRFLAALELVKDWATAAFLCAKLASLRLAVTRCIDDDARLPMPYARPSDDIARPGSPTVQVRHSVVLRHQHLVNRFESIDEHLPLRNESSSAFDEGVSALCQAIRRAEHLQLPLMPVGDQQADKNHPGSERGRRVVVICGARGHGKGGQSDRLVSHAGDLARPYLREVAFALGGYLELDETGEVEVDEHGKDRWRRSYVLHVNMSFSNELGPIIRQLVGVLERMGSPDDTQKPRSSTLDQLEALDRALRKLVQLNDEGVAPRLMLVIGNAGVLFDGEGRPKNGHIQRVLRMLMSKRFRPAPVDILMYVGESQMPAELRVGKRQPPPLAEAWEQELDSMDPKDSRPRRRLDRLNIAAVPPEGNTRLMVHALARTRLSEFAAAYFPGLAHRLGFLVGERGSASFEKKGREGSELAWRLYLATGGSRFAMTVMLALLDGEPEGTSGNAEEAARALAQEFLVALSGPPSSSAIEKVIEFSLDRWEARHISETPLSAGALPGLRDVAAGQPGSGGPHPKWVGDLHDRMREFCEKPTRASWRLASELLWHLGAFSHPVESGVLLTCRRVDVALRDARGRDRVESWEERLCSINAMLELMVHWCLVFRIGPRPIPPGTRDQLKIFCPQDSRYRYAPHRHMQRHVVRLMGGRNVESTQWDQFTLTTYASLPDEAPMLRADVHRSLTGIVRWLTDYPSRQVRGTPCDDAGPNAGADERALRSMVHDADCIRAAYYLVRSTYSLGVVSHLSPESAADAAGCGHMEEYGRLVSWITDAACYWERAHGITSTTKKSSEHWPSQCLAWCGKDGEPAGVFYASELVWLYHESGVISLAQGKLNEAEQLLTLAEQAARRVEADDSGSLHSRIRLHSGLVQIERGRPHRARQILGPIAGRMNGHAVPPLIADFYLGLIEHIGGNYDAAKRQYKRALSQLRVYKRSRACAFVLMNSANLTYRMRPDQPEEALALANEAISLSQQGGHEDLRHLAILERARIYVDAGIVMERNQPGLFEQLRAAERYGVRMDIPRLTCEVHELRARLLMSQGEYEMSARDATKSLEIASLYDLKLKKARGLLTLAQVYRFRKDVRGAGALAAMGRDIANACDYYTCVRGFKELELSLEGAA
jgi:tetratricopeptide (TPR) repeat protein